MRIDLHTHSDVSDGTDSPAELVRKAAAAGLDVVALTDHDATGGHKEAANALDDLPRPLTLVTGAELSCRVGGVSMHMLAYLFDPDEPVLAREMELVRTDRVRRARAMVGLCRELGAPITWEQVLRIAGDGAVGRPHIAAALVEAGVVGGIDEAFTPEWIGSDGRVYVRMHELDPFDAVRLVRNAGGVTVFAHRPSTRRQAVRVTVAPEPGNRSRITSFYVLGAAVRVEDVYVRGTGVRLPSLLPVADAVASGACDARAASRMSAESVSVSEIGRAHV